MVATNIVCYQYKSTLSSTRLISKNVFVKKEEKWSGKFSNSNRILAPCSQRKTENLHACCVRNKRQC